MRLKHVHSTVCLIPGIDGDIQVVMSTTGHYLIDVQGSHVGAAGHLRHDHGTVRLTYEAIVGLRDLLDQIEEPLEDRQPALPAFWAAAKLPGCARYRRRAA